MMSRNMQVIFLASICVTSANTPLAKAGPMAEVPETELHGKGIGTGWDENWGLNGSSLL